MIICLFEILLCIENGEIVYFDYHICFGVNRLLPELKTFSHAVFVQQVSAMSRLKM